MRLVHFFGTLNFQCRGAICNFQLVLMVIMIVYSTTDQIFIYFLSECHPQKSIHQAFVKNLYFSSILLTIRDSVQDIVPV